MKFVHANASVFMALATFFGAAHESASSCAADIEGSLEIGTEITQLTSVVAFEINRHTGPEIIVVASDRPIDAVKLRAALADDPERETWLPRGQSFVILRYSTSGEPRRCRGSLNDGSFSLWSKFMIGDVKIAAGRLQGEARLAGPTNGGKCAFKMKVDVAIGLQARP